MTNWHCGAFMWFWRGDGAFYKCQTYYSIEFNTVFILKCSGVSFVCSAETRSTSVVKTASTSFRQNIQLTLQYIVAENQPGCLQLLAQKCENCLTVDKVMAIIQCWCLLKNSGHHHRLRSSACMQHCCKGEQQFQRKMPNFEPSYHPSSLISQHQNWHK